LKTEPGEVSYSVPIRRTRWPSFFIGAAALVASALPAAALGALLTLPPIKLDGALVVIAFGLVWGAVFFVSFPWQRRCARALDSRRPGILLAGGVLTVPLEDERSLRFRLDEPHELRFGWSEYVVSTVGGPTTHTRGVLTYATVSQAGLYLFLKAEDSARAAQAAGWPKSEAPPPFEPCARLWAHDLVALIQAIRTRPE
jgi:hypothetical protein